MKIIKIRQNYRGKYNLCSNEETLSFIMDICEDNQTIELDGVKARLQLNSDLEPFDSPEDNICNIFDECWEYANSVWSSTNYKAQCLTFAKVFQENYKEFCENRIHFQKEWISKEIERLHNKVKSLYGFDDISYEVGKACNSKINLYQKWIDANNKELESIKEGSEKYLELTKKIQDYQKEIDYYKNSKIEECYYENN